MKYLLANKGLDWFRTEVESRAGFKLAEPRKVHWDTTGDLLGWHPQGDGKWFYGLWVEEGRIADSERGNYFSALRQIATEMRLPVRLTTNCNVLLADVEPEQKARLTAILEQNHVPRPERLTETRRMAHACVALPTCGLALAESERVFPGVLANVDRILTELDLREEKILVRMTGCPNGCARPYNADISFVGRAPGKYAMYVGGSSTGDRLAGLEFKSLTLDEIPGKVRELLEAFVLERKPGETFTQYWGRTHVNGPAPHPEQFHVELRARQTGVAVEA